MSYTLVQKIPPPYSTLTGKTLGPAVALGLARRPGPLFMHVELELRQAVHAAGWPLPEAHLKALAELEAARAEAADLGERVADLEAENETLRGALNVVKPRRRPVAEAA